MGLPILLVGRGGRSRPGAAAALGTQLPADLAGHGSAAQKALDPGPDQGAGFIGGGAVGKCWHTAVSARLAHRTVPIQRPLSGADAAKWRCETRIQPPFRDPLAAAHAKTVTAAFDSREGCTDRTKPGPPPTVQPLKHLILLTLNRKFNPAPGLAQVAVQSRYRGATRPSLVHRAGNRRFRSRRLAMVRHA